MKNFQCYFGEHADNRFNFKNGVNLIIGNNGGGKSKLYDAFFWVLNDQVFNSDLREFQYTKDYGEKLVSARVTRGCSVGATVECEVTLELTSANETEYRLTRIFHTTKISESGSWLSEPSKLIIERKKNLRWYPSDENQEAVLNRVMPKHLKPYMWFQGEQVDGLMNLTDKSSLTQIVKLLSDIQIYEEVWSIARQGLDKSASDLRAAKNRLSKNSAESAKLEEKYQTISSRIQQKKEQIKSDEANLEQSSIKLDELISKVSDAERKSELKKEKGVLETQLTEVQRRFDEVYKGLTNKIIKDHWVLKGSEASLGKYATKFKSYVTEHQERIITLRGGSVRLPANVPQPVHIHSMLEAEHCYVCDRPAPSGTAEYESIKKHLSKDEFDEDSAFVNNLMPFYERLYNESLSLKRTISDIDRSISSQFGLLEDLRMKSANLKEQLRAINEQFEGLLEDDSSENIVSEFRVHTRNRDLYSGRIAASRQDLERLEKELKETSVSMEKLVVGEIDKVYEEANKVFTALEQMASDTHAAVYSNIISELEYNANRIFESMTQHNKALSGKIKLKMLANGTCVPEIVDSNGYILSSSNDSNIILVKLSLIIAILTSSSKWSENYTLISDAPTSKMAYEYSLGFYQALSENFSQSLVMTYDFIDEKARRDLIQNGNIKVGSIYILQPKFDDDCKDDITKLSIKSTMVKI